MPEHCNKFLSRHFTISEILKGKNCTLEDKTLFKIKEEFEELNLFSKNLNFLD